MIGVSMLYAISGIAFNHLKDWDPFYSHRVIEFKTKLDLRNAGDTEAKVKRLLDEVYDSDEYSRHYYAGTHDLYITLKGNSTGKVDTTTGEGRFEIKEPRRLFYQSGLLHHNPNDWWKWFSDFYAVALLVLCITALVIVKGKKGLVGTGGLYTLLGFLAPVLIYFLT